jgi:hypothetical protein
LQTDIENYPNEEQSAGTDPIPDLKIDDEWEQRPTNDPTKDFAPHVIPNNPMPPRSSTRARRPPTQYQSSFENRTYNTTAVLLSHPNSGSDPDLVLVEQIIMTQLSIKAGLKRLQNKA